MSETRPFRVIIIGGGPVGLSAAHVFNALKIDYIVLEKRHTTIQDPGAANFLNPFSCRIYDQLGIYDQFEKHGSVTLTKINTRVDGSAPISGSLEFASRLGYPLLAIDRRHLLRILTDQLPDGGKNVRTNAKVMDIKTFDDGVEVILEDGSVVSGSIVVGTDGTWSKTRALVQKLARASSAIPSKHEEEVNSILQTLYGRADLPSVSGLQRGVFVDTHTTDKMTQGGLRNDTDVFFVLYKMLPKPATTHHKYTEEETQAYADEFGDVKVLGPNGPAFRDILPHSTWHILVNQETGFAGYMHHKRIVLAGDSAVKVTSVLGLGLNSGVQAVVNLGNALRDVLDENSNPSTGALEKAFKIYEQQTEPLAAFSSIISKRGSLIGMWQSWFWWFVDQWLMPYLPSFAMTKKIQEQYFERMPPMCSLIKGLDSSHLRKIDIAWGKKEGEEKEARV